MLTETLVSLVTKNVFGYLVEEIGVAERVQVWLGREPQRLAFQVALAQAYADFATEYPEWARSLFDEHFMVHRAAPILALCLGRDDKARPEDLAEAWADQLGQGRMRATRVSELSPIAGRFLNILRAELRKRSEFQPLFDSRAQDTIGEAVERTANYMETLQAELRGALQRAQRVAAEGERGVAVGKVVGSTIITGDVTFQSFAEAPAPVSRHIRLGAFRTLVNERTRRFVGRKYIFEAVQDLIQDTDFPSGYLVISGEPGIGKTALLAQMVSQGGHVHHFNIASQNICSPRAFLSNICAQLIVRYELAHGALPPEAEKDGGFLSQLLAEVALKEQGQPTLILVDALDEVEEVGLAPGANILFLPSALPEGIFIVVTTRETADFRLFVDRRRDIHIRENDPHNLDDVRRYIQEYVRENWATMAPRIEQWGVDEDALVKTLTEKSEGNFMYLVYVLHDIRDGRLTPSNVDRISHLPKGLQAYYQRHWRSMREMDGARFEKFQEPVVCILATVKEPVTIAQVGEWTDLKPTRVKEVIDQWREFLNVEEGKDGMRLYRIYHASFQDFLKEEVGLVKYHDRIAATALNKIPGFFDGGLAG